jgi:uncharacterized protein (DUF169 family)
MPLPLDLNSRLTSLGFTKAPVAIAFLASPPPGVEHVGLSEPAGCGYWRLAAEGRTFYTTADDHASCPIGAFTHGVVLSAEASRQLEGLVGTMVELKYIKREEVSAIPHRSQPMQVAVYAPLDRASFAPDAVVFRGNVRQIMLLSEAARSAGVFEAGSVMGRPACAMIPQAIAASSGVASVGCIGNRVYTDLSDGEMYLTVPGARAADVLAHLPTIVSANQQLEQFHRQRAAAG